MLTQAQRATLRAFIVADPVMAPLSVQNTDAAQRQIRDLLNANASPNFTVFKGYAQLVEIAQQMDAAETASLTSADHSRMQTFTTLFVDGISPTGSFKPHVFLDDVFSAKPLTRARLGNASNVPGTFWKRLATRLEKVFAAGTGTDSAPATLVVEGLIDQQEVSDVIGGI